MPTYLVTWEIDIFADSPEDAAKQAREIQLDRTSLATHFTVRDPRGAIKEVDLGEEGNSEVGTF